MRSLGILMLVLVALVGAFMLYILFQDTPGATENRVTRKNPRETETSSTTQRSVAPINTTQPTNSIVGEGDDVWVQQFDPKTERLLSEYRAAHYDPPVDGQVKLTKPEFRLYGKDGSVVQIAANDGLVVMPEDAGRQQRLDGLQTGQPRRGTLNQVTISTFDDAEETTPSLVCTVPVLKFDNDASRINTDVTLIDGQLTRADQVPIKVRGEDYDFDGRGLTMRWNEREQRLEMLEIAHPEKLVVKNPGAFGQNPFASKPVAKPKAPKPAPTTAALTEKERRRQKQLAAQKKLDDERKAAEAAARPLIAYLASFNDNVVITQDNKPLGTADKMLVRFSFEDETAAATQQAQSESKTETPATKPVRQHQARPADEKSESQIATISSDSPIEIVCSGKLMVNPIKYEESGLKSPKDKLVEFVGLPVKLNHEGSSIVASSIRVGMDGKRFLALGSDQFPEVSIIDPSGTRLTAPSIVMDDNLVTIVGKSEAEMLMNDDNNQPQKVLINWNKRGELHLVSGENNQNSVDVATFTGDVQVNHPKMKLSGEKISMNMEPGNKPGQPDLKSIEASGKVKADLSGDNGESQTITAENFSLGTTKTAEGKSAVSSFKASGNAVVADPKQTLSADQIEAAFKPIIADKTAKADLTQIEHLVASGNVSFKAKDGTQSTSDLMKIETNDGKQQLVLQGNPASLGDAKNQLKGKIITANPDGSSVVISGPGAINGVFGDEKSGKKQRPMDITWTDSFVYDGIKNVADAVGGIEIKSKNEDSSIDSATGKRLHIVFKDPPKSEEKNEDRAALLGGNKGWQLISLTDDVEISSVQYDPADANKMLKRVHVFVPLVNISAADDGSLGIVKVPSGGRMLYENNVVSAPRPVDVNDPNPPKANPQAAEMGGATAVQWTRSMVYDPAQKNAVIDGDVVVVHKAPDSDPIRMLTQKLIADFETAADGKTQQLKEVRAGGGATFISPQVRFDAAEAKYDPTNERVIAAGTPGQPVEINDTTGASSGSFQEVWWNLKTNRPERLKGVSGSISR